MCLRYFTGLYVLGLLSFHTILIIYQPFYFEIDIYDGGDVKEAHLSYISTLAKKKPVILCGDLNVAATPIDLRNPKSNERSAGYTIEERTKFQELLNAGFIDTYRYLHPDKQEYSWWSYMYHAREKNIGWRIDYFLVSEELKDKIKVAKIYTDVYGSDHAPISLEIEI